MMYVDFQAGTNEYKLRLNTRATVALEKTLGCNPITIFGAGDRIPTVTEMVSILHASLQQFHHGITLEGAFGVFDAYLEDGHSMTDFIAVIVDVYKHSGLIKEEAGKEEKN
jgi:hypothetical protein